MIALLVFLAVLAAVALGLGAVVFFFGSRRALCAMALLPAVACVGVALWAVWWRSGEGVFESLGI